MVIISFIFPLLNIFFITTLFIKLFNKKFGDCIPLTIMILPLILVLVHYTLSNLKIGIYIIYLIVLLSLINFIINIRNAEYRKNVFSTGTFVFIFIYCFIYLLTRNAYFYAWDEFAHWGPMINMIVDTNKMYVNVSHASYPPLIQLFEYSLINLGLIFEEYNLKFAVLLFDFLIFCAPVSEKLS